MAPRPLDARHMATHHPPLGLEIQKEDALAHQNASHVATIVQVVNGRLNRGGDFASIIGTLFAPPK